MAWIESHTVLSRHKKLKELARDLRLKPVYVMGHLHALWHDALEQQEDGDFSSWTDELIAESSQYQGDAPQYVRLLQKHGWLDGKLIHDWLDYAGRYLEAKYRTSKPERLQEIHAKHNLVGKKSDFNQSKISPPNLPNLTNQKNPPEKAAAPVEKSPYKIDLKEIDVCGLDEPAKHRLYNETVNVFKARGWDVSGDLPLRAFKAVSERVRGAKPREVYPYFSKSLAAYANENAETLSAQSKINFKKRPAIPVMGQIMAGMK